MNGLLALHPQVEALSIRKHTLEAADIQELGREAGEDSEHPLNSLAQVLQEKEVAEKLTAEWNRKFA